MTRLHKHVGHNAQGESCIQEEQVVKGLDGRSLGRPNLLSVAHVAVISGDDWPQFQKQVASRLPVRADLFKLWLMPTTGTKL